VPCFGTSAFVLRVSQSHAEIEQEGRAPIAMIQRLFYSLCLNDTQAYFSSCVVVTDIALRGIRIYISQSFAVICNFTPLIKYGN